MKFHGKSPIQGSGIQDTEKGSKFSPASKWDHFNKSNVYRKRDVGITHPNNEAYIRLTESGDIEIVASSRASIILSAEQSRITIVCDELKLVTSIENGVTWNTYDFNAAATSYHQPFLVERSISDKVKMHHGIEEFLG